MRLLASVSAAVILLAGGMGMMPNTASAYTYYDVSSSAPMVPSSAGSSAGTTSSVTVSPASGDSTSSAVLPPSYYSSSSVSSAPQAVDSPYPYFRRDDGAGSVSTDQGQQQYVPQDTGRPSYISDVPKVGLSVESDRSEANPGDDVRYWIRARNLYSRDLPQWKVAFFFDPNDMQILDAGGGRIQGDHILFNVPASRSDEEHVYSVRVHLFKKHKNGKVIRVYGSMVWDGTISPACSKNELRIIEKPPVTGADDDYTGPVENLQAFLRPVNAATHGSPMPLLVWIAVAAAGIAIGGAVSKKLA